MTVAGQTFTVTQAAALATLCPIMLSPTSQQIAATAVTGSLNVTAPTGCAWTAVSDAAWLTITSSLPGTGTGSVHYATTVNIASTARTATVSIGNQAFTLAQNAAAASCSFVVSPLELPVGAAGGVSVAAITAAPSCGWAAASNSSWIALTSPATGSGSSQVSFTIAANSSTSARSGSLTIAGQTVAIKQAGAAAAAACTFTLSDTTQAISVSGGQSQVGVTASSSTCMWTASTSASWISIVGSASGTGNGKLTFSATVHTSTTPRTGTLTIAGQTATLTQLGQPLSLEGDILKLSGSCPHLTFTLAGQTVHTTNETKFSSGSCSKLKNGTDVEVEGVVQIDGAVLASRVTRD